MNLVTMFTFCKFTLRNGGRCSFNTYICISVTSFLILTLKYCLFMSCGFHSLCFIRKSFSLHDPYQDYILQINIPNFLFPKYKMLNGKLIIMSSCVFNVNVKFIFTLCTILIWKGYLLWIMLRSILYYAILNYTPVTWSTGIIGIG